MTVAYNIEARPTRNVSSINRQAPGYILFELRVDLAGQRWLLHLKSIAPVMLLPLDIATSSVQKWPRRLLKRGKL